MKDILTIIVRLTLSCLIAGLVMGGAYIVTDKAKKQNEYAREQQTVYTLLGYSDKNPVPAPLALSEIYRYVVDRHGTQSIGYLVPDKAGQYLFVNIDLDGHFLSRTAVALGKDQAHVAEERTRAILAAIGVAELHLGEEITVVTSQGKRVSYLLTGRFPGFKTFIRVMLALDTDFNIFGLEILEHEEDPGLGGEIEKKYFRNQFTNKSFATLKHLQVVKAPLPEEYRRALTGGLNRKETAAIMRKYKDTDIYALTGATISSRHMTEGVRSVVENFAYRVHILDRVLAEQGIVVSF
nr:FMN-binding protein [uncultured Desulfobulbus sp.]